MIDPQIQKPGKLCPYRYYKAFHFLWWSLSLTDLSFFFNLLFNVILRQEILNYLHEFYYSSLFYAMTV